MVTVIYLRGRAAIKRKQIVVKVSDSHTKSHLYFHPSNKPSDNTKAILKPRCSLEHLRTGQEVLYAALVINIKRITRQQEVGLSIVASWDYEFWLESFRRLPYGIFSSPHESLDKDEVAGCSGTVVASSANAQKVLRSEGETPLDNVHTSSGRMLR